VLVRYVAAPVTVRIGSEISATASAIRGIILSENGVAKQLGRLLVVVNDLQPYGSQRVAVATANGLRSVSDCITLLTLESASSGDLRLESMRRESLNRPRGGAFGFAILVARLRKYLLRNPPTYILSHMMFSNIVTIAAIRSSKLLRHIPVVVVEHSPPSLSLTFEKSPGPLRALGRHLYPCAAEVVGVSDAVTRNIEETYGLQRGRARRIYNPVDSRDILMRASSTPPHPWLTGSTAKRTVVCVAGFRPVKQQELLVSALNELPDVRALFVGDGPRREAIEKFAHELGVADRIEFVGYREDATSFVKHAAALILPSRWEGFGLAAVEAAALGVPVVASASGGLVELIPGKAPGVLVSPSSASSLVEGIARVLDNRSLYSEGDLSAFQPSLISAEYAALLAAHDAG
jgi:glycosyltransferase involved in cell wall biosynthesis